MGVEEAQEVPTASRPLRHGVRIALCRLSGFRVCDVQPLWHASQRSFKIIAGWPEVLQIGQGNWKVFIRNQSRLTVASVDDGKGLAPVALSTEEPVAQLVGHGSFSDLVFLEPGVNRSFGFGGIEAIQEVGIDGFALTREGGLFDISA